MRKPILSILAASWLLAAVPARADPIHTGVEQVLLPLGIITAPFFLLHDQLFGSDALSRKNAQEESRRVLKVKRAPIPINGLYTGSISLRYALYGMLVENRLPFIEIDADGAAWLAGMLRDPAAVQSGEYRYLRLEFAHQDDPACLAWKTSDLDVTRGPPVRPGTCVAARPADVLHADMALRVDDRRLQQRERRWEIQDLRSNQVLLSLPFWDSAQGKPYPPSGTYRASQEPGAFADMIRQLAPAGPEDAVRGHPWVMATTATQDLPMNWRAPTLAVAMRAFPYTAAPSDTDTWVAAYARAEASGKPVLLNHRLLILPSGGRIGSACGNASHYCGEKASYLAGDAVLTLTHSSSYRDEDGRTSYATPMSVYIVSRDLDGKLQWSVRMVPQDLPEAIADCSDYLLRCSFRPNEIDLVDGELVLRGVVSREATGKNPHLTFEWRVPLERAARAGSLAALAGQ